MQITIPQELSGKTFYQELLPNIYYGILKKEYDYVFDMSSTMYANPEGVVNLLNSCALIKTKYNTIPFLIIPENKNLLTYLEMIGFFSLAQTPNSQVLRFHKIGKYFENDVSKRYHIPKTKGIFSYSDTNQLQRNVSSIINDLAKPTMGYTVGEIFYFDYLEESLSQLVRNIIDHNFLSRRCEASGYYMAQKMPYNKLEIAISDIGKGFRNRIVEMIEDEEEIEVTKKYKSLYLKLKDNSNLFKKSLDNPNLIAILAAIDYRNGVKIPGLWFIKEFVVSKGGTFKVHSGNITVIYSSSTDYQYFYHDNYYSGCHLKIDIPLS